MHCTINGYKQMHDKKVVAKGVTQHFFNFKKREIGL